MRLRGRADVNSVDHTRSTALASASGYGKEDLVHLLLSAGADGHEAMVGLLERAGASRQT